MPSQKNIYQLKDLKHQLKDAKSIVVTDYLGLTVSQMQTLRQAVKDASGQLLVAKNTLISLSLKEKGKEGLPRDLEEALRGPTALLISHEDEISPLKALTEFAKDNDLPKIKAGLLDDRVLTAEEVTELSKLPGRTELQAKLIGTLNSPISGFTHVLKANLNNLVYVLKDIQKSKKGGE